jgi:glycosyltransferase involved in cell wall biosynthesis
MKRVLLVSYYFPPMPEAGALRGKFLARYLPRWGWQPTVIALAYPGVRETGLDARYAGNPLVRASRGVANAGPAGAATPASPAIASRSVAAQVYRRLVKSYFPDAAMGWIVPAYRAAAGVLAGQRFDAVITTAHPASAHLVGFLLASRFGLPWIADYRDPWTDYEYDRQSALRTNLARRLERTIIRRAARVTAVSDGVRDTLRVLHGRSDVVTIPNGVAADDWSAVPARAPVEFNLVYGGMLYGGRRSPDTLFAAAAALRRAGSAAGRAVRFDFYTADTPVVLASAERHGIGDAVRTHALVPRAEMLQRQREAAGLAIILRDQASLAQEYGSKIFEYLGAGRPILATGPRGSVVADLLAQSGAGYFAADAQEAAAMLSVMYERYAGGQTDVVLRGGFQPFTAIDLAQRFGQLLDQLA